MSKPDTGEPVMQIITDLIGDPANSAFYMERISPAPADRDPIQWGDRHVWWGGARYHKIGLNFDPAAPLH
ncbi:hypothetical protein [Sphingomonas abietis]|uniref:Uncharacterized protein n=1 Tax=Sphingomonas abietis TaxID=3012344 RepID=A0ABY7NL69_9SPHN|nr:hypothetical protein [Sphingomonas abietis]WBO21992.1 hypothetical protein PBT88_17805 [Sphingomonas abietis]